MRIFDTIHQHCIVAIELKEDGLCALGCLKCGWADIMPFQQYDLGLLRLNESGAITHEWTPDQIKDLLHGC